MRKNNMKIMYVLVLVSVLLLSGLGMAFTGAAPDNGTENPILGSADATLPSSEPRQGQHVQAVAPANIPVAFVGEQDFGLNVILRSIAPDDNDDSNGDGVVYTSEIKGVTIGGNNIQKYNFKTRQFQDQTTPVFTWDTNSVVPTDNNKNNIYLYAQGSPAMGAWKYVMNQSNSYLDEDNDGNIDLDEYWAIQDGQKTFSGLVMNVLGTAKPGYYRMKVEVTYWVQDDAPLNTSGVGSGATSTLASTSLWTNEALGAFDYYYWLPWNLSTNSVPSDLEDTYTNDSANFDFHKVTTYQAPANPVYSNIWEAIPDNGVARPNWHPDINNDARVKDQYDFTWLGGRYQANDATGIAKRISSDF